MAKRSKRYRAACEKRKETRPVPLSDAVAALKRFDPAKFDETVNLVVKLGIDPKQSNQQVRGSFSLPHGIGRSMRVIAFAEGDAARAAQEAGAIEVGTEDLAKRIQGGWLDFDVAIAHPAVMRHVGKLGRLLGPLGKMPSPKSGTVTENVAQAVAEFRAGKIEFRNDSGGNVHAVVGKMSFSAESLLENVQAFLDHIRALKPSSSRGNYIQKVAISATMSPSVLVAVG